MKKEGVLKVGLSNLRVFRICNTAIALITIILAVFVLGSTHSLNRQISAINAQQAVKQSLFDHQELVTQINLFGLFILILLITISHFGTLHIIKRDFEKLKVEQENGYINTLLIESSPDCIKLLDANGKLLHLNNGGLNEHGFSSQEEIKNWNYLKTISSESLPFVKKALARALKGEIVSVDIRHVFNPIKGGCNREWCNMTFSPVKDSTGRTKNVLVVSRNITEKKKADERTEELTMIRNKFIQIASQQFGAPLSAMRWNLESLLTDESNNLKPLQKELLKYTYAANSEIITRIHDLFAAIEIEENLGQSPKKDLVSIEGIVSSVIGEISKKHSIRNISVDYKAPNDPLPEISGEIDKIRQVVEKVIENAFEYSRPGKKIEVKLVRDAEVVKLEVTDFGIGIPKGEQHRIFTRFYRASNAYTLRPEASGLGLYLAKNFAIDMNGDVNFVSREGKGSTFTVTFPTIIHLRAQ